MKGEVICILVLFQKLRKIKKYLIEKFGQEVLTLHLLTITLRRNSNPPGFFSKNITKPFNAQVTSLKGLGFTKNKYAIAC